MAIERWEDRDDPDMGKAYAVTGPLNLDQFEKELAAAARVANAGLVADGDLDTATKRTPVLLYVTVDGVQPRTVLKVAKAHQPAGDNAPAEPSFEDVVRKAKEGGALTYEEQQVAIQGLLARLPAGDD